MSGSSAATQAASSLHRSSVGGLNRVLSVISRRTGPSEKTTSGTLRQRGDGGYLRFCPGRCPRRVVTWPSHSTHLAIAKSSGLTYALQSPLLTHRNSVNSWEGVGRKLESTGAANTAANSNRGGLTISKVAAPRNKPTKSEHGPPEPLHSRSRPGFGRTLCALLLTATAA
jgi:hypothetical protein